MMTDSLPGPHPKGSPHPDRRWVLYFALIAMLVTTLPYFVGYAVQGEGWRFTGFVFGVEDGNTYIGKMLRGAQGDWLFRTPYTPMEQRGAFIFLPYLLLGKLTAPPNQHDQLVVLFHIFRFVGGILAVYATYDFAALFLREQCTRRWAVVMATFGGGLGWFLVLVGQKNWLGSLPIDFYSPETFSFLGTYGIAHLPWARAFFLWGLRSYLVRGGRYPHDQPQAVCKLANWHPGFLWLLTGIAQPITGMVIGVVAGYQVLGLIFWQSLNLIKGISADWELVTGYIRTALQAGVMALPLVLYNLFAFTLDPFLKIWVEQSRIPAPHILHYLAAYGLVLPFVIAGIPAALRKKPEYGALLVVWVVVSPILVSIPFSLQRRLVEGLWVALVVLGLWAYEESRREGFKRAYLLWALTFPTTLFLLAGGFGVAARPAEPVFRPVDEVAAFEYLAESAQYGEVVLSAYDTGNGIPAWTPVFVVIGHRPESAGIRTLAPRVEAFYQSQTSDEDRISLLSEFGVDYVFWGPSERDYGNWDPSSAEYLDRVYQGKGFQIFKVVPEDDG